MSTMYTRLNFKTKCIKHIHKKIFNNNNKYIIQFE